MKCKRLLHSILAQCQMEAINDNELVTHCMLWTFANSVLLWNEYQSTYVIRSNELYRFLKQHLPLDLVAELYFSYLQDNTLQTTLKQNLPHVNLQHDSILPVKWNAALNAVDCQVNFGKELIEYILSTILISYRNSPTVYCFLCTSDSQLLLVQRMLLYIHQLILPAEFNTTTWSVYALMMNVGDNHTDVDLLKQIHGNQTVIAVHLPRCCQVCAEDELDVMELGAVLCQCLKLSQNWRLMFTEMNELQRKMYLIERRRLEMDETYRSQSSAVYNINASSNQCVSQFNQYPPEMRLIYYNASCIVLH